MPLILLALLCCARPAPPGAAPEAQPEQDRQSRREAAATRVLARQALPGLEGLACDETGACTVLLSGQLRPLDPDSLQPGQPLASSPARALVDHGTALLVAACPGQPCLEPLAADGAPPPPPQPAEPLLRRWNRAIEHGWRSPFAAVLPSPGGGRMTLVPGPPARILVTGGGIRQLPLQASPQSPRYLRDLALHPSGREAYLLAWPGQELLAFDPQALRPRWTIPLEPAAHGLFVEGSGRLLLLEEGGQPDPEALLDLGADRPALPPGADPASDLFLHLAERPDARTTAVVDLAVPRLVWREDGRYLSLQSLPDGTWLLATTRALVHLESPPLPPAP